MEARTRDLLFGNGRGADGMRGVFAPSSEPVRFRDLIGTIRSEGAADWMQRRGIINAEHRAGSAAASGADELVDLAGGSATRGLAGAAGATAGTTQYANPIYHGLMAQQLMRDHGFVAPTAAPDGGVLGGGAVADDVIVINGRHLVREGNPGAGNAAIYRPVAEAASQTAADAPIAAAADDVAAHVAEMEQRMLAGLQRLGELPQESKIPVLTRAVDATAAHGGDTYDVLARTLLERPLDDAVVAFERSLDDAAKVVAPVVDDAAKVVAPVVDDAAKVAAPVVADAVADVVTTAVPQVVEAAVPKVIAAAQPRLIAVGGDDALRGVMSFSAGIDDTLRLLAKF